MQWWKVRGSVAYLPLTILICKIKCIECDHLTERVSGNWSHGLAITWLL